VCQYVSDGTIRARVAQLRQTLMAVRRKTRKVRRAKPRSGGRGRIKRKQRRSAAPAEIASERKPLTIRKLTLPAAALRALPPDRRSAILLLGLFLNEANWLRKLLVGAAMSIGEGPEGQASFALTVQLATTLAAKIHEGWQKVRASELARTIHTVALPDALRALRRDINRALATPTIRTIRNSYSFHYPAALDFAKLTSIDDADTVLYVTEGAYNGDVFSHLSSLAALEPLLAIETASDWRNALVSVWNEVTHIAGLYCFFLSEMLGLLINEWLSGQFKIDTVIERHVPEIGGNPPRFFVHAPSDLDAMRAQVAAEENAAGAVRARRVTRPDETE